MRLRIPDYYNEFHCIAVQCKHNCCLSWEIDVDQKTKNYYDAVEGEFGERLRTSITKEKEAHFKMLHGRCPFLMSDHLCEVYKMLGEGAMCEICREFPRAIEDYGTLREKILLLSCEEAGRILFCKKESIGWIETEIPDEFVKESMDVSILEPLEAARNHCITLLQERKFPFSVRLQRFLMFARKVQECIDQNQLSTIKQLIKAKNPNVDIMSSNMKKGQSHTCFRQRMDLLAKMEVMEQEWEQELNNVIRAFYSESRASLYEEVHTKFQTFYQEQIDTYEHLMVYFCFRYLLKAGKDSRFYDRASFAAFCCVTIRDMDQTRYLMRGENFTFEDRIETTRIFCKQVEHSQKSLGFLADQVSKETLFSLDSMLTQMIDF